MPRRPASTSPLPSLSGEAPRLSAGAAAVRSALLVGLALGALALAAPQQAHAQAAAAARSYSIPAGSLDQVLTRFASAAGAELSVDAALTRGKSSNGLNGSFTVQDGFAELLKGQGLQVVRGANGAYSLRAAAAGAGADTGAAAGPTLGAVTVTAAAERPGDAPAPYAGGQVASGARLGFLGNRDVMDTPFNITSYTAQTIADQQARTIVEILENDPSVLTTTSRLNGMDQFNVRGYAVNNSASSFGGLYGVGPYYRGTLMGVERVEVLKGPGALINGMSPTGSIGGNINLVPKRAGDEPLTQFTTRYQSDASLGGQVDIGRRFGPDQSTGIRLNVGAKGGDGSYDGQKNSTQEATLGLDYRGDRVRLSLDAGYIDSKTDGSEGVLGMAAGSAVPSPPGASSNYYQRWNYWNTLASYGAARAEWDIAPNVTAHLAAGARKATEDMFFPSGTNLTASGNFTEVSTAQKGTWSNSTVEIGLKGRFATGTVGHEVSAIASTFSEELGFGYTPGPNIASNIYSPNLVAKPALALPPAVKTSDTRLSGFALADTLSFAADSVLLTLGMRHQNVRKDNFSATGAVTTSYNESANSPAVGLVVKPFKGLSLYGNYIEALTQGPTAPASALNKGQVFAPYQSRQYEAGVKFDAGEVGATVSVFQITQPSGLTNPATQVYSLDGEQRNRGIEFNTFGQLGKNVRLLGGVMFLDAKLSKTANGLNDGRTAVSSPRVAVRLGSEWDLPSVPGLTLTGRALYTSSQYVDNANTQKIPGWTRFDAGLRYRTTMLGKPVAIRASVENLFGRDYWLSGNLYRGAPRTYLLSATFDF
ncbi:TonB-dependent siderophore receptor [Polaromonas sp. YR568]|uniref:TonB-dependent siderophore receptor n=1 Tax=Polaromonas sp. YR568 TaxID=1855301 RepID=UPI00398C0199